ncbi:hypothetical protein H4V95_002155 [Arthrobacter sp. CAN_C5]|nr:hypothetical protein [Arthrobacter sp. CAN_C5]
MSPDSAQRIGTWARQSGYTPCMANESFEIGGEVFPMEWEGAPSAREVLRLVCPVPPHVV